MGVVLSEFIQINHRNIHVRIHNPKGKNTIVCWHGLARNCFDFETIAKILSEKYRVICPDTLGRGLTQWAENPSKEYNYANYVKIAAKICDHYDVKELDWIGTSMGGVIGIILASNILKDRMKSIIINDVGPEIPEKTLQRIFEYTTGEQPEFNTFPEFENYIAELYDSMGKRTKEQWFEMSSHSVRRKGNGKLTVHFDPDMVQLPDKKAPIIDLWEIFQMIDCPILLLHGFLSDVLTEDIVKKMLTLKPGMNVVTIPDCGHAPGLHLDHHIGPVRKFLSEQ